MNMVNVGNPKSTCDHLSLSNVLLEEVPQKQFNTRPMKTRRSGKMRFTALLVLLLLAVLTAMSANLTAWREHRRNKRFLIYQDSGVIKLVTGTSFPVDFEEKNAWRQLMWFLNVQYQFPEPTSASYWWKPWLRRDLKGPLTFSKKQQQRRQHRYHKPQVDTVQGMLYEFAVEYMNQRGQDGRACLKRLICENGQVHEHNGLYAQLLHRLLRPHRSLDVSYLEAYKMGRYGVNCRSAHPTASYCLLDDYVHVHERGLTQSYLST